MKCMRSLKSSDGRPEVNISAGVLLGRYRKTSDPGNNRFSSFTRIPYAKPPVGNLRFSPPEPAEPWDGILDASKPCPKPIQNNYVTGLLEGQEDCLYLNVYKPEPEDGDSMCSDTDDKLPVMFWVYGGGFIMGDATEENYLPGPLLDTGDVIIVTGNYRVGPLGFMCLEDDVMPGNLALWDQRLMLLWIQKNIAQFGGDPTNVTVFGNSAGSFCCLCLYVSPLCEALFHRVIAQSGPLTSNSAPMQIMGKKPALYARTYAESLGCCDPDDTSETIIKKLRQLPVAKLQSSFNIAGSWADMVPSPWKPLVDTWSTRPIMPVNPRDAIMEGKFNKVPLLTGVCSEEGIMMVSHIVREPERWMLLSEEDWWKHVLEISFHIHPEDASDNDRAMMLNVCKEYGIINKAFDSDYLIASNSTKHEKKELLSKMIKMFSDAYFKVGTLDTAQLVADNNVPVFQYRFAYDGEWKFADLLTMSATKLAVKFVMDTVTGRIVHGPGLPGVCHAEELHYLFSPTLWGMRNTLPSSHDRDVSKKMAQHWVNFAKYGDPSIPGQKWSQVQKHGSEYMEITDRNIMKTFDEDEMEKVDLWKDIFNQRKNLEPRTTPIEIKLKPKPNLNINSYTHQYKNLINFA